MPMKKARRRNPGTYGRRCGGWDASEAKELRNVSASPLIRNSDGESMAAVW